MDGYCLAQEKTLHAHEHFYNATFCLHDSQSKENDFFCRSFGSKTRLDKMQSLIVFGEINKYLDTEIIEIESQFWNTDQEKNLIV